jgi:DNA polymerase-3 subunit gamma/tau
MDVVEIDAASHTGVDAVREVIIERVSFLPAVLRYKVYIIDEVHMLSTAAFNALLKTLEEPPPQVVFVLATTDPHKVPATIRSRCLRFDFHPISAKRHRTKDSSSSLRMRVGQVATIQQPSPSLPEQQGARSEMR